MIRHFGILTMLMLMLVQCLSQAPGRCLEWDYYRCTCRYAGDAPSNSSTHHACSVHPQIFSGWDVYPVRLQCQNFLKWGFSDRCKSTINPFKSKESKVLTNSSQPATRLVLVFTNTSKAKGHSYVVTNLSKKKVTLLRYE
jgi:hypothetical protein